MYHGDFIVYKEWLGRDKFLCKKQKDFFIESRKPAIIYLPSKYILDIISEDDIIKKSYYDPEYNSYYDPEYNSDEPRNANFFSSIYEKEIEDIICGRNHSIAVCKDGIYQWGDNSLEQLGKLHIPDLSVKKIFLRESDKDSQDSVNDEQQQKVIQISCGRDHTIAFVSREGEKSIYSWGSNSMGQLGRDHKLIPFYQIYLNAYKVDFFNGKEVKQISCGFNHSIVICDDGVYSWGYNNKGQLGLGDIVDKYEPTKVKFFNGKEVKQISCGAFFSIASSEDKKMYSWGDNNFGQLGIGVLGTDYKSKSSIIQTAIDKLLSLPREIISLSNKECKNIICGSEYAIAICQDGVYSWGNNNEGQLGLKKKKNNFTPTKLNFFEGKEVKQISCGDSHSMAVCDDRVYAWGNNTDGQLGLDNEENISTPTELDLEVESIKNIALSHTHSYFLLKENRTEYKNL